MNLPHVLKQFTAFGFATTIIASFAQAASPTLTSISGVTNNQTISGIVNIQAISSSPSGTNNLNYVTFFLSGPDQLWWNEHSAPYYFMGDKVVNGQKVPIGWDTTTYPDGLYHLTATAVNATGQGGSLSIDFTVRNNSFSDEFSGASISSDWTSPGSPWTIQNGAAHNFERGYAALLTSKAYSQSSFVIESKASGFGPTQGPSPADSVGITFCQADLNRNNYYQVVYYPSSFTTNNLYLEKVYELTPGGEFTSQVVAAAHVGLPASGPVSFKIVRNGGIGLTQVYIDLGSGYSTTAILQAIDKSYLQLGHFGWVLESEATGAFDVDSISVKW